MAKKKDKKKKEKYVDITIEMTKEEKKRIKKYAKAHGMKFKEYIVSEGLKDTDYKSIFKRARDISRNIANYLEKNCPDNKELQKYVDEIRKMNGDK